MNILLFPVKLGLFSVAMICLSGALACGYQPAYGGRAPEERLSVVSGEDHAARFGVAEAVLHGVRAELNAAGALAAGTAHPRVVVEVLRLDEGTRGVTVVRQGGMDVPLGRATAVAVAARAWVEPGPHLAPERDTGDVRRAVVVSSPRPEHAGPAFQEAAEAAGLEVGRALARRVLGEPVASDEPL